MPPGRIDWDRERERAAQASQSDLAALAKRAGFEVDHRRGKASHVLVTGRGLRRPITIPTKTYKRLTVQIIQALREAAESDE